MGENAFSRYVKKIIKHFAKKSETLWFLEQPRIQPPLPTPGRWVARLALVGAEVPDVGGN